MVVECFRALPWFIRLPGCKKPCEEGALESSSTNDALGQRVEADTMKVPRVRFTVRRMMVAVAVAALAFWIVRLSSLRRQYLEKAANHASFQAYLITSPQMIKFWEDRWTAAREGKPAKYPWPSGPPFVPSIAEYHDQMRIKYKRAARYPWLPVAPDALDR